MLHNYPESKAFCPRRPPSGEVGALVEIKNPDAAHDRRFFGLNGVQNGLNRGIRREQKRQVPDYRRVAGGGFKSGHGDRLQRLRVELEENRRLRQLVLALPARVQLAQPAAGPAGDQPARRPPRGHPPAPPPLEPPPAPPPPPPTLASPPRH